MEHVLRVQQVIGDFTSATLAAIPNAYGRLMYLASLRDLSSGRYDHAGLNAVYSVDAVQEALEFCHREIFQKILETPLSLQEQDLRECLESMPDDLPATLAHWRKLEAYHILPPEDAADYLRELFFSNLRTLLEILESEQPPAHSTA
jgi:hypothetical protein